MLVVVNFKALLLAQFLPRTIFLTPKCLSYCCQSDISVSKVNLYCFELRKTRISSELSRNIGNYAMVTQAIDQSVQKRILPMTSPLQWPGQINVLESELLRQKKLACFLSSETGKVVVEGISSHTSKNLGHGFYCYVYCIVAWQLLCAPEK